MFDNYSSMTEAELVELYATLAADGRSRWQRFYVDRARPCPFFAGAPDENLYQWVQEGRVVRGTALDLGCGNGRNAIFLAKHGFTVHAIDYSESAVAWAREEVSNANVRVSIDCSSVFELQLEPESCDLIYDSGCFHHIAPHRRHQYVRLIASALKPGGALGLVCFAPEGGSGLSDDEVYTHNSLGGGLGYDELRLREIWGELFHIASLQRMHEQSVGSQLFGKSYLWALLARKRAPERNHG